MFVSCKKKIIGLLAVSAAWLLAPVALQAQGPNCSSNTEIYAEDGKATDGIGCYFPLTDQNLTDLGLPGQSGTDLFGRIAVKVLGRSGDALTENHRPAYDGFEGDYGEVGLVYDLLPNLFGRETLTLVVENADDRSRSVQVGPLTVRVDGFRDAPLVTLQTDDVTFAGGSFDGDCDRDTTVPLPVAQGARALTIGGCNVGDDSFTVQSELTLDMVFEQTVSLTVRMGSIFSDFVNAMAANGQELLFDRLNAAHAGLVTYQVDGNNEPYDFFRLQDGERNNDVLGGVSISNTSADQLDDQEISRRGIDRELLDPFVVVFQASGATEGTHVFRLRVSSEGSGARPQAETRLTVRVTDRPAINVGNLDNPRLSLTVREDHANALALSVAGGVAVEVSGVSVTVVPFDEAASVPMVLGGNVTDPASLFSAVPSATLTGDGDLIVNAGAPRPNAYGTWRGVLELTDGAGYAVVGTITLAVDAVNDPPRLRVVRTPPRSVQPDESWSLTLAADSGPLEADQSVTLEVRQIGGDAQAALGSGFVAAGEVASQDGAGSVTFSGTLQGDGVSETVIVVHATLSETYNGTVLTETLSLQVAFEPLNFTYTDVMPVPPALTVEEATRDFRVDDFTVATSLVVRNATGTEITPSVLLVENIPSPADLFVALPTAVLRNGAVALTGGTVRADRFGSWVASLRLRSDDGVEADFLRATIVVSEVDNELTYRLGTLDVTFADTVTPTEVTLATRVLDDESTPVVAVLANVTVAGGSTNNASALFTADRPPWLTVVNVDENGANFLLRFPCTDETGLGEGQRCRTTQTGVFSADLVAYDEASELGGGERATVTLGVITVTLGDASVDPIAAGPRLRRVDADDNYIVSLEADAVQRADIDYTLYGARGDGDAVSLADFDGGADAPDFLRFWMRTANSDVIVFQGTRATEEGADEPPPVTVGTFTMPDTFRLSPATDYAFTVRARVGSQQRTYNIVQLSVPANDGGNGAGVDTACRLATSDNDNDNVPSHIEYQLGTNCDDRQDYYVGNVAPGAATTNRETFRDEITLPGGGKLTQINFDSSDDLSNAGNDDLPAAALGVVCADCVYYEAYDDNSGDFAPIFRVGDSRSGLVLTIGDGDADVQWIGRDRLGNWIHGLPVIEYTVPGLVNLGGDVQVVQGDDVEVVVYAEWFRRSGDSAVELALSATPMDLAVGGTLTIGAGTSGTTSATVTVGNLTVGEVRTISTTVDEANLSLLDPGDLEMVVSVVDSMPLQMTVATYDQDGARVYNATLRDGDMLRNDDIANFTASLSMVNTHPAATLGVALQVGWGVTAKVLPQNAAADAEPVLVTVWALSNPLNDLLNRRPVPATVATVALPGQSVNLSALYAGPPAASTSLLLLSQVSVRNAQSEAEPILLNGVPLAFQFDLPHRSTRFGLVIPRLISDGLISGIERSPMVTVQDFDDPDKRYVITVRTVPATGGTEIEVREEGVDDTINIDATGNIDDMFTLKAIVGGAAAPVRTVTMNADGNTVVVFEPGPRGELVNLVASPSYQTPLAAAPVFLENVPDHLDTDGDFVPDRADPPAAERILARSGAPMLTRPGATLTLGAIADDVGGKTLADIGDNLAQAYETGFIRTTPINAVGGVYDFRLSAVGGAGQEFAVLLPLRAPLSWGDVANRGVRYQKYRNVLGGVTPFDERRGDRVLWATGNAAGDCPSTNPERGWRREPFEGDRCVLLVLRDDGANDAEVDPLAGRGGAIADPGWLEYCTLGQPGCRRGDNTPDAPRRVATGGGGGGGGGAVGLWLLPLLAAAPAAACRRRRRARR